MCVDTNYILFEFCVVQAAQILMLLLPAGID